MTKKNKTIDVSKRVGELIGMNINDFITQRAIRHRNGVCGIYYCDICFRSTSAFSVLLITIYSYLSKHMSIFVVFLLLYKELFKKEKQCSRDRLLL